MPSIQLDFPESADARQLVDVWPDLATLDKRGLLVTLDDDQPLGLTVLPRGMQTGRASICFRFQLPNKRVVLVQSSLRTLWSVTIALAARYGEDFMQVQPTNEVIARANGTIAELTRQLLAAKQRLGEPPTIDVSEADAAWERKSGGGKG